MKILRYIGFIPSFFLVLFLGNLIVTFISGFFGFDNGLDQNWFLLLTKPFFITGFATILSVSIYPNDNKKIAFIVLGLILILTSYYTTFYMWGVTSEIGEEISNKNKIKQVVGLIASFCGLLYAFYYSKREGYLL